MHRFTVDFIFILIYVVCLFQKTFIAVAATTKSDSGKTPTATSTNEHFIAEKYENYASYFESVALGLPQKNLESLYDLFQVETDLEELFLRVDTFENQAIYKFFDNLFLDPLLSVEEADTLEYLESLLRTSQDTVEVAFHGRTKATHAMKNRVRDVHMLFVDVGMNQVDLPLSIYITKFVPFFVSNLMLPCFVLVLLWLSLLRT